MQGLIDKPMRNRVGGEFFHRHLHGGVTLEEHRQRLRHETDVEGSSGADAHLPGEFVPHALQVRQAVVHLAQRLGGIAQKSLAGFGEHHALADAVE